MRTIDPAPGTYDASDGFMHLRPSGSRHTGIDFGVASGTDFPAFASGVVTFSGWEPTGGNGWCLAWKLDGTNYTAAYLHGLRQPPAKVGDRIVVGQRGVFISGNSGSNSQGSHVHLTLSGSPRAYQGYAPLFDPWAFIQANKAGANSVPANDGLASVIERMVKGMTVAISTPSGTAILVFPGGEYAVNGTEGQMRDNVPGKDRNVGGVIDAVWGKRVPLNQTDVNTVLELNKRMSAVIRANGK